MRKKDEQGNVMIEASIVMTIAVVMVAVLISLGLMLYQKSLMQTVATETAVDIANVYGLSYRDPVYGYIDDSEFYNTNLYRYLGNLLTDNHDEANERKGTWYGLYRLKKGELARFSEPKVFVEIIQKPGTIIQHQVVVTITAQFDMPLTTIWNGDNSATYMVTGRADCVDLLDYFNTVGTVESIIFEKVDDFVEPVSGAVEFIDKMVGGIKKIWQLFN